MLILRLLLLHHSTIDVRFLSTLAGLIHRVDRGQLLWAQSQRGTALEGSCLSAAGR